MTMKRQTQYHTRGHPGFRVKKQHQYCEEDGSGNKIWVNYDPRKYKPKSDTRVV